MEHRGGLLVSRSVFELLSAPRFKRIAAFVERCVIGVHFVCIHGDRLVGGIITQVDRGPAKSLLR